ncbi:hypothetical protein Y1Q_0019220 [Alligator mississippiensis]|uniref:Uncharacterized protein n=1 Tax=Alligator mississippiensis TaxID=8496 RepID=A0A151MQE0_ALLMI|nr:hypothetical protein Y1Q_0019220 [Alligator mississippiensis]
MNPLSMEVHLLRKGAVNSVGDACRWSLLTTLLAADTASGICMRPQIRDVLLRMIGPKMQMRISSCTATVAVAKEQKKRKVSNKLSQTLDSKLHLT